MNKVLRKRLLRDLRANFGRYLALFLLFVLGLYLVVSIVGSSEMLIQGTENQKSVNMVEDGQFTVFLPLSDEDLNGLTADGTTIEPMFSFDLKADHHATLRMFRNRDKIDLIQLDEGEIAAQNGEAVIEKGYAEAHDLHIGDSVKAGGADFRITGIGSAPDYDMCIAKFSDTAVDKNAFGRRQTVFRDCEGGYRTERACICRSDVLACCDDALSRHRDFLRGDVSDDGGHDRPQRNGHITD